VPRDLICSWELLKYICELSREIKRQVGILINRKGSIEYVVLGDHKSIHIPQLDRARTSTGRLRGLRFIHTHLKNEPLSQEDITDLSLLRFDYLVACETLDNGTPGYVNCAHLLPPGPNKRNSVNIIPPTSFNNIDIHFQEFIENLENEFRRKLGPMILKDNVENAIIVTVAKKLDEILEESIEETKELASTCNVRIADIFIQYRKEPDPKYLIGKGKLKDLILRAVELDANLLIFNQDLNPGLARRISDLTGLKIIDRTQLILDVFAQRAKSRDGKLQVELAQLKYALPRLSEKNTMMSRLTGGIGGRGPGETKLEINRRRAMEKVNKLEKDIVNLSKKRFQKRQMRKRSGIPIVSILGYTNAGKSTLLNNLTKSSVTVGNKPFSTLDPASRRLRFPKEREIVITDTVGFIKDLPSDLINAFRATLEEIGDADLILHIFDLSNPNYRAHIEAVIKILKELKFHSIQSILVMNKIDKVETNNLDKTAKLLDAIPISAIHTHTFDKLLTKMESFLWSNNAEFNGLYLIKK